MQRNNKPNEASTVDKTNEDEWILLEKKKSSSRSSPSRNPNPLKYNKSLLNELGILALSTLSNRISDEKTLNSLANIQSITLGNRNLKLYRGVDSYGIVLANEELKEMFDNLTKEFEDKIDNRTKEALLNLKKEFEEALHNLTKECEGMLDNQRKEKINSIQFALETLIKEKINSIDNLTNEFKETLDYLTKEKEKINSIKLVLATIIKEKINSIDNLTKEFKEALDYLTKEFEEKIDNRTREALFNLKNKFEEALQNLKKKCEGVLDYQTKEKIDKIKLALDTINKEKINSIDNLTKEFKEAFDYLTKEFEGTLDNQTKQNINSIKLNLTAKENINSIKLNLATTTKEKINATKEEINSIKFTLPTITIDRNAHKEFFNNLFRNNDAVFFITRDKIFLVKKIVENKLSVEPLKFRNVPLNLDKILPELLEQSKHNNFSFKDESSEEKKYIILFKKLLSNLPEQSKYKNFSFKEFESSEEGKKYIILYKKLTPLDNLIKFLNSSMLIDSNPTTKKQKELLEHLTNNKITFNSKVFFGNTQRREEVFFPVAIDLVDTKSSFYLHPWTSDSHFSNVKYPSFNVFVTAVCMFGSYLKGSDDWIGFDKALIKHDIKFTGNEKINRVSYEIEPENPYQEIVFRDFEKQLKFINCYSSSTNKIRLTCHLPYVDYMLFGIKLFLHGRMTLEALYIFIEEISKEKEHYEEKLKKLVKDLKLEEKIELNIQSPFTPLLNILKIETPESLADSLTKLGVHAPLQFDSEDERKAIGIKQETILVTQCLDYLQNNNDVKDQSIWKDLGSFNNKYAHKESPIENLFAIGNIFLLTKEAACSKECDLYLMSSNVDTLRTSDYNHLYLYKDNKGFFYRIKDIQENQYLDEEQARLLINEKFDQPAENPVKCTKPEITKNVVLKLPITKCSFLPTTEKQIQTMYGAFRKEKENHYNYETTFNINYLDTTLTYNDAQQHNTNQGNNSTNTNGLAFYFNHPHVDQLYTVLCDYLPQSIDPLYKLAKENGTSVNSQKIHAVNCTHALRKNSMFNNSSTSNGHFVTVKHTEHNAPTAGP